MARLKAKKAESTSDLSTDTETRIRKRKKLQFSSSDSDISDNDSSKRNLCKKIDPLPLPPKITKQKDQAVTHEENHHIGNILTIKNIFLHSKF